jgi:ankyrin repeat protein
LHWCAKRNHTRICSLLLEYGADTDAVDMGGKTPLYYALKEKNPEIVGVNLPLLFISNFYPAAIVLKG